MRILHLLSQTELTGAEVYAKNLVEHQTAAGHQVLVASDKIHVQLPVQWKSYPLSVNTWQTRRDNARSVRSLLLSHQIDIIHAHSRAAVRVANLARRGLPVALVTTIHGRQHLSWGKRLKDIYGEYKILVCDNLKLQFEKELKLSPGSLKVLRNPFSFSTEPAPPKQVFKKRLAFVGRSSGPKGRRLRELFKAGLFSLLERHPDWQLDIIASNPENFGSAFLEEIRAWKNIQQIKVLGQVKDLQRELPRYDLILGAGRVAVEALAQNVAVISFGEYTSHGLVALSNIQENLASNFGDMGTEAHEGPLNAELVLRDLEAFIQSNPTQPIEPGLRERLLAEFYENAINDEILETYKAAIFKKMVPQGIPCLMYHKIPATAPKSQHRIFVTAENFKKHLAFFQSQKFQTMYFSELAEFWNLQRPYSEFPRKPLLLTFDDGYQDNLTEAAPLLKSFAAKATLFLLADQKIRENTWDLSTESKEPSAQLLSPLERQELFATGVFEIGSHGLSHANFTKLNDQQVLHEMTESKKMLEAEFKTSIKALAYPFGAVDPRMHSLAKQAGYLFAVNTDQGGLHLADNPRALFRVNIFPEENTFSLWKKTSSWYRQRFYRKHGK